MLRYGNNRGLGPFTLPEIVLYIVSAIAMLIFLLVLMGYAGSTVPKMALVNEEQMLSNYATDAFVTLPNWDGDCGCFAKSENLFGSEIIYPGLIPSWKLDRLEALPRDCNYHACSVPFFIDENQGAGIFIYVKDLETLADWENLYVNSFNTTNLTINRFVGIEYPNGIVHAGRFSVTVYH